MTRIASILLCVFSISCACGTCSHAVQYTIRDLGTLGGYESVAYDINNSGQAVGYTRMPGGDSCAFLWQNGSMQVIGTSGYAAGINNGGQVAGATCADGFWNAFLWQSGSPMQDLGTLPEAQCSEGHGINNLGHVVGTSQVSHSPEPRHAFLWRNGTMQDLGTLGGAYSGASDINDNGQVVGESETNNSILPLDYESHAFLWQDGEMQDLGTFGGNCSSALGINNAGQVVGGARTAESDWHACLWQNGTMQDLGTLGGLESLAYDINNNGLVVGVANIPDPMFSVQHAFIWNNGSMQDLGTLGGTGSTAYGINDMGQIVGWASDSAGCYHAVLWEPVPEPSSLLALAGGLGSLLAFRRRR